MDYHPAYWFLNGLSFPNTIHVGLPGANGWADWIAAHPGYDPFITGSVSKAHPHTMVTKGEKVLIRMINMGYETQPMHMHGFHGKVIGSDQRAWYWANTPGLTPFGLGLEKNTLTIGSGETYDWLVDFGQQSVTSTYPAGSATGPDPMPIPRRYADQVRPNSVPVRRPASNTTGLPVIPDLGGPPRTISAGRSLRVRKASQRRASCSRSTTTTITKQPTTAPIRAACSPCSCRLHRGELSGIAIRFA